MRVVFLYMRYMFSLVTVFKAYEEGNIENLYIFTYTNLGRIENGF